MASLRYALGTLCAIACVQPVPRHHRPDAGAEDSSFEFVDADPDAALPPRSCREALDRGTTTDGIVTIDPDGTGPEPTLDVYCDMSTAGGGWMLVMAAGFTDYPSFAGADNAIAPRPSWGVPAQGTVVSTTLPTSPAMLGALEFARWPSFGAEFLITSTINHWIRCTPGTGSFVTLTEGTVACQVVKPVPGVCTTVAPSHFFMVDSGPSLTVGTNRQALYYFFDGATNNHWPTHDPCGGNQTNQLHNVSNPMTAIYLRPM